MGEGQGKALSCFFRFSLLGLLLWEDERPVALVVKWSHSEPCFLQVVSVSAETWSPFVLNIFKFTFGASEVLCFIPSPFLHTSDWLFKENCSLNIFSQFADIGTLVPVLQSFAFSLPLSFQFSYILLKMFLSLILNMWPSCCLKPSCIEMYYFYLCAVISSCCVELIPKYINMFIYKDFALTVLQKICAAWFSIFLFFFSCVLVTCASFR